MSWLMFNSGSKSWPLLNLNCQGFSAFIRPFWMGGGEESHNLNTVGFHTWNNTSWSFSILSLYVFYSHSTYIMLLHSWFGIWPIGRNVLLLPCCCHTTNSITQKDNKGLRFLFYSALVFGLVFLLSKAHFRESEFFLRLCTSLLTNH